ncbi:LPXTG cell wall anchor domain-containing protein [Lentilactobacillus hilgardii]|nr:LPXTG cell wall anchor domain-containing protein [Lentilactobacillus hilgardii]MCV3743231.1 LPXTG cell wall anchor domain-containing protein [Lentilactobacillus hilgardii]
MANWPTKPNHSTGTTTNRTSRNSRDITGKTPIEKASVLPQTGDKQQNWLSILGDVSLAVIVISGAMIFKRRKRD